VSSGGPTLVLGAAAGALVALGTREAVLAFPALARWVREAVRPLTRAREEGYAPSLSERRKLAALGAGAALVAGLLLAGPGVALPLAVAGAATGATAVNRGRSRYRRSVESALPEIAMAVADSLSAGRSLRGSLTAAAASLDGPAQVELARLGAELEMGTPTGEALGTLRDRMSSARVDAFAAALLSQRLAGGDLAGLLRRFAVGAAEQDRAEKEARSATAQARFTGMLVVAMPTGAALFAELMQPGFFARMLASPPAAAMLGLALVLQLAGFAFIQRLSRVSS
jgi:tight adherence protein B